MPRDLPEVWRTMSRKEQTTVVTLYQLKSCYQGGILLDYRQQLGEIASCFGYSASKLRTYIQLLLDKGWAREEKKRKNLVLISSRRLGEALGCRSQRMFRVESPGVASLRNHLTAKVIENALRQQRYQVRQKQLNQTLCALVGTPYPQHLSPAARQRYSQHLAPVAQAENQRLAALPRYEQELVWTPTAVQPADAPHPDINPDVTLSRRTLARLFGHRSAATGHRLAQRLVKAEVLGDQPRRRALELGCPQTGVSYEHYQQLRRSVLDYDPRYRFFPFQDGTGNGRIMRQLPNLLTVFPLMNA